MSVFVHVGQAGNQIGQAFWNGIVEGSAYCSPVSPGNPFFASDGKARAVLVDTEPKVVHLASKLSNPHALNSLSSEKKKKVRDASGGSSGTSVETDGHRQQSRKQQHCRYVPRTAIHRVRPSSIYRSENVHFEQFGRGNNWALGYNGREGKEGREGSITFRALESLRREAERCDVFDSVVLTHSIAGGTGSGLGSRILEEISHAYPTQYLVSAAVTPFTTGETPLQHYNSLLSLAHLQQHADACILFSNDDIASALRQNSARRKLHQHSSSDKSSTDKKATPSTSLPSSVHAKRVWKGRQEMDARDAVSFPVMNEYIGNSLIDLLAPLSTSQFHRHHSTTNTHIPTRAQTQIQALQPTATRVQNTHHSNRGEGSALTSARRLKAKSLGFHQLSIQRPPLHAMRVQDIITSVCPLPSNKFLELWSSTGLVGRKAYSHRMNSNAIHSHGYRHSGTGTGTTTGSGTGTGAGTGTGMDSSAHSDERGSDPALWSALSDALARAVPACHPKVPHRQQTPSLSLLAVARGGHPPSPPSQQNYTNYTHSTNRNTRDAGHADSKGDINGTDNGHGHGKSYGVAARSHTMGGSVGSTNAYSVIEENIHKMLSTVPWNPFPVDILTSELAPFHRHAPHSLTLLLNRSHAPVSFLAHTHRKAKLMFDNGAYLHWYARYGCVDTTFQDAFDTVGRVMDNYTFMSAGMGEQPASSREAYRERQQREFLEYGV